MTRESESGWKGVAFIPTYCAADGGILNLTVSRVSPRVHLAKYYHFFLQKQWQELYLLSAVSEGSENCGIRYLLTAVFSLPVRCSCVIPQSAAANLKGRITSSSQPSKFNFISFTSFQLKGRRGGIPFGMQYFDIDMATEHCCIPKRLAQQ